MFAIYRDFTYRILIENISGAWVIEASGDSPPEWVDANKLSLFQRIPVPDKFVSSIDANLSSAAEKRLALIRPLLDDIVFVIDSHACISKANEIAKANDTTAKRVRRLFYRYLATGRLTASKAKSKTSNKDFDWAIRTFYYNAKRPSLKKAYETMILLRYTSDTGELFEKYPSWDSFRHYYYRNELHKPDRCQIARNGLTNYMRNNRPLTGSAMQWRSKIGCYQMDATIADIFLLSELNRKEIIGRPSIFLAVDTATQIIAGFYIGFECGESAALTCLANAAKDKTELCKEFGIHISKNEWPCQGIPSEIIVDKGREFNGKGIEELSARFGTVIHSLPPFRPDEKSLVERAFGKLNELYKTHLRGKGIVEDDAQERWSVDYRAQAALTLSEFTKIILTYIIHLNANKVLRNIDHLPENAPRTSAALWLWYAANGKSSLVNGDAHQLYILALPRKKAKITRRGITHETLCYVPCKACPFGIGDTVVFAYDIQNTKHIYIMGEKIYDCTLAPMSCRYENITLPEVALTKQGERKVISSLKRKELESVISSTQATAAIIKNAAKIKSRTFTEKTEKNK